MKNYFLKGILKILASLPLGLLYLISDLGFFIIYHVAKYRIKVVRANLTGSFPEKSRQEIKKIEKTFYRYLSDQIVETLKLLNMSDKELIRRVTVKNYEIVNEAAKKGKNAVLLLGHYGNWEWAQEISRYFSPLFTQYSIYHPLRDKFWDDLFKKLRGRWGNNIIPMNHAPRTLLSKDHQPWVCGFIADGWYMWHNEDNWIDFLNHKTWFIPGPEVIGDKVGSEYFYLEMNRIKRGKYEIIFYPIKPETTSLPYPHIRQFWKEFEKTIEKAPAYWLWSHKRWK